MTAMSAQPGQPADFQPNSATTRRADDQTGRAEFVPFFDSMSLLLKLDGHFPTSLFAWVSLSVPFHRRCELSYLQVHPLALPVVVELFERF